MSERADNVKAGVFVMVALLLMVGSLGVVAGLRLFEGTKRFTVEFEESVTGLEPSSTVRYNGVPVGRVTKIGFAPDAFPRIQVVIEVQPEAPIRTGTTATLKPQGITGVYYIDLSGGEPEQPLLEPGARIEALPSLTVELTDTLRKFGDVVGNLNQLLVDNRDSINSTVRHIEEAATSFSDSLSRIDDVLLSTGDLAKGLNQRLSETLSSVDDTLAAVRRLVESDETQSLPSRIRVFLDEATGVATGLREQLGAVDLASTLEQVADLIERTALLEREVTATVREVRLGIAENRGGILRAVADVREFAQNLKMASREVRRDPSRLLFGRETPGRTEEDVR